MTNTRSRLAVTATMLVLILLVAIPLAAAQPQQAWAAPAKAAVASVTSDAPGKVTVTVKKAKGAKGYQFWASTSKKFDQASSYGLVSAKSSKTTATLTGLPEGKKAYVKARAYVGKTFGKWSAVKSVTVKKSTELADAKTEAAKWKKEADDAKAELGSAKSENTSLRSENASLRSENASLRAEIARLKSGGNNPTPQPWNGTDLRFVTGGMQGTYYGFGHLLAEHATSSAGVPIAAYSSDGSKANVESIEDGLAELAFCQSDVLAYACQGTNLFEGMPSKNLTVLAELYDEQVQIVTCNPDIKTVADLRGKRVSIGAPNSGVYYNAIDVLGAYGITERDITPTYQSFSDSTDSLKNEQIDAAFIVNPTPTTAITDLSIRKTAYLVGMDAQHASSLAASKPYYTAATISAHTYPAQDKDVTTVAVSACLIAGKDVPEDDVYAFVKDVFDSANDPAVASTHMMYSKLSVAKGASVEGVPYHKGAARFFEEEGYPVQGVSKPLAAA